VHPGYWTEKLADPVLMRSAVFYGGDPSYSTDLPGDGIRLIDPWDPESVYRTISNSLLAGYWEASLSGIDQNRRILMSEKSFHRVVEQEILGLDKILPGKKKTVVRAQHPQAARKTLANPVYQLFKKLR
jgi:hypothetical protein